jgi:hypothetical protein
MADNVSTIELAAKSFVPAADEVSFSGDTTKVQLIRPVHVGGSEGAKTLSDLTDATGLFVHVKPGTTGGLDGYHVVAQGSNNAANIKASAGQIYTISGFCKANYAVYAKFYNKATTPDPTVDVPVFTYVMQAGVRPPQDEFPGGKAFSLGISVAIVKGIDDNDNTDVTASDCVLDVGYK